MEERATESSDSGRKPVNYRDALRLLRELVLKRRRDEIPDTLWLLEHPPTLTWGSSGGRQHLLAAESELAAQGFALCPTERGGDVTCHEPGQLVGYPIVRLGESEEERDLHRYLRLLEEALISVLGSLGLEGRRIAGRTGVWLPGEPPRKVAAMGIRCSGWVTSHGFALNVENDLEGFRRIIPCGIADAAVTSLERELGRSLPGWEELCALVHLQLEETLERPLRLVRGPEPCG
jgi:lipoyl(octanoyl) transferase